MKPKHAQQLHFCREVYELFQKEILMSECTFRLQVIFTVDILIFRQGFEQIQVQGVEFYQMGQGGRIGRYPVNFRLARKTPSDTYLKDNSIHDSMTRWITLQGTHGVLLERNVGYKSIGHGFLLKDATEIDNKFYSNIGIFARAAVDNNAQNPRKVPGIYASPVNPGIENVPFHSDFQHPTVFWISNGWNDFQIQYGCRCQYMRYMFLVCTGCKQ